MKTFEFIDGAVVVSSKEKGKFTNLSSKKKIVCKKGIFQLREMNKLRAISDDIGFMVTLIFRFYNEKFKYEYKFSNRLII